MKLHLTDGTTHECQIGGSLMGHQATSVELDYGDFMELSGSNQSAARRESNRSWFLEHVACRLVTPEGIRARQVTRNTRSFVLETLRLMNGRVPDDKTVADVAEKVSAAIR